MRLSKPLLVWAVALLLIIFGLGCASDAVEVSQLPEADESTDVVVEVVEPVEDVEVAVAPVEDVSAEVVAEPEAETEAEAEAEVAKAEEVAETVEMATIEVRFIESAPKDKFLFSNTGSCELAEAFATIDLTNTAGKLIFDTTGEGAGVEVFQPFEISEGELELVSSERVADGDTGLTVRISSFAAGAQVGFTIDVDDTLTDSDLGMIRVTDSEMSGAEVLLEASGNDAVSAAFGEDNVIVLSAACA